MWSDPEMSHCFERYQVSEELRWSNGALGVDHLFSEHDEKAVEK
jgi:hypothetical protein